MHEHTSVHKIIVGKETYIHQIANDIEQRGGLEDLEDLGVQIWKDKETSENLALVSRVMILDREEATVLMEVKMRIQSGPLSPNWATWFRS